MNIRAGRIADTVAQLCTEGGILNGLVWVNLRPDVDDALAVRTTISHGFGGATDEFYRNQRERLHLAKLQAVYAKRTARSASEQADKLKREHRSSVSYDVRLTSSTEPAYAHDKEFGLTVVTVAPTRSSLEAARISEQAIELVNKGHQPAITLAAELVWSCLNELQAKLPSDRSGFCLLTHPSFHQNPFSDDEIEPIVICSQAVGALDPGNYGVVMAKAKSVALSRRRSGTETGDLKGILGATPIKTKYGERIMAAGGLIEGSDDLEAIFSAIKMVGGAAQAVAIEELSKV